MDQEKLNRDYARAQEVRERYNDRLWKYDGVVSVGIGWKITGGRQIEEMAIVIGVEKKRHRSELSVEQLIPEEIEGIKTDIDNMGEPSLTSGSRAPLEPFYELPKGHEDLGEDGS